MIVDMIAPPGRVYVTSLATAEVSVAAAEAATIFPLAPINRVRVAFNGVQCWGVLDSVK
jgi:hypothetical protein